MGDTIYTSVTSVFHKFDNDSLIGFKYLIKEELIHPGFKVPMTLSNYYNGNSHIWNLDSEVKKIEK